MSNRDFKPPSGADKQQQCLHKLAKLMAIGAVRSAGAYEKTHKPESETQKPEDQ